MVKYVDNFYEWVKQMIKEYQNSPDYIQFCAVADEKYSILINHRTGKVTKAKCHEDDIFNEEVGLAIAWARYKGYEIPKERRVVQRPLRPSSGLQLSSGLSRSRRKLPRLKPPAR